MASTMPIRPEQLSVCQRFGMEPVPAPATSKIGVSLNVREDLWPVNGLRHRPDGETTGWYVWAGEVWSDDDDFFVPLHVSHLADWRPVVLPYLALPPGWRFLVAPDHEDVWQDPSLLDGPLGCGPAPSG